MAKASAKVQDVEKKSEARIELEGTREGREVELDDHLEKYKTLFYTVLLHFLEATRTKKNTYKGIVVEILKREKSRMK